MTAVLGFSAPERLPDGWGQVEVTVSLLDTGLLEEIIRHWATDGFALPSSLGIYRDGDKVTFRANRRQMRAQFQVRDVELRTAKFSFASIIPATLDSALRCRAGNPPALAGWP